MPLGFGCRAVSKSRLLFQLGFKLAARFFAFWNLWRIPSVIKFGHLIFFKTEEEISLIRQSCLLVSRTLAHIGSILRPGLTGVVIDREAETLIRDHHAVPAFKGYRGFPATLCVSVNDVVVHGIPSDREFREGDIVSVDCGVLMNGYHGDAAYTFAIGEIPAETMLLLQVTKASLYRGIAQATAGKRIGDVSYAIQHFVERDNGYAVVRELVGHGIGKSLHEDPEVPNYGKRGNGVLLKEGLVIAIEPMINLGKKDIRQGDDGWTIRTADATPSAHFEHTVAIGNGPADILSDHHMVEAAVAANQALSPVRALELSVASD
jgi:methionyl aminopeptidase